MWEKTNATICFATKERRNRKTVSVLGGKINGKTLKRIRFILKFGNSAHQMGHQTQESKGCGVRSTKPTAGLLVLMKCRLSFTPWKNKQTDKKTHLPQTYPGYRSLLVVNPLQYVHIHCENFTANITVWHLNSLLLPYHECKITWKVSRSIIWHGPSPTLSLWSVLQYPSTRHVYVHICKHKLHKSYISFK